ncbi:hypothetical protein MKX01_026788 [Papaver californicum]|nr:hypothetical protein MKX01_026788 [Papaver californicum]
MKFIALLSLFLMCLVLSNTGLSLCTNLNTIFVGVAALYECEKYMEGVYRGPCREHCKAFCHDHFNGAGECYQHRCLCRYYSRTPCDSS